MTFKANCDLEGPNRGPVDRLFCTKWNEHCTSSVKRRRDKKATPWTDGNLSRKLNDPRGQEKPLKGEGLTRGTSPHQSNQAGLSRPPSLVTGQQGEGGKGGATGVNESKHTLHDI